MHQIVKILVTLILAAAVLGAAKYLDGNPRSYKASAPQETVVSTEATAQTEAPEETAAPETQAPAEAPAEVPTEAPTEAPTEKPSEEERFQITLLGDCILGADLNSYFAGVGFIKTVGDDYAYPFRNVAEYLNSDELTLLNLEGPLTDVGNPVEKRHAFRGPTEYVNILTENSVEAVSISNNHVHDYSDIGYESTVSTLREAGIPFVERDNSCIVTTKNGLKIGLYGAVYYKMDTKEILSGIKSLKEKGCDLVIFAPHWGAEGSYYPTEEQRNLAYEVIDAGADIVWGTHPHVLQPVETYKGGLICYSLGNFSFGGNTDPGDYDTALIQQEVIRDAEGNLSLGELTLVPASISSIQSRNNFQPTPYDHGSMDYDRVMKKLDGSWTGPNLPIQ